MNGWKNYETWNVSLWIQNDEGLYNLARQAKDYDALIEILKEFGVSETPDKVSYEHEELDYDALNEMLETL